MTHGLRKFVQQYVYTRLFEWIMGLNMTLLGFLVLLYPTSIASSAFRYMLQTFDAKHIGSLLLVFGTLRLAALIANGRTVWTKKYGPLIRIAAACTGGFIWVQLEIALLILFTHSGIPSPGLANWAALAIGEVVAAYHAGKDLGRSP